MCNFIKIYDIYHNDFDEDIFSKKFNVISYTLEDGII